MTDKLRKPFSQQILMNEIDDFLGGNMDDPDFDWMTWTRFLRSTLDKALKTYGEEVREKSYKEGYEDGKRSNKK